MLTDLIYNLMKSTGLVQLVGKLHQAGKIHNLLHQVCRVFGCVFSCFLKLCVITLNKLSIYKLKSPLFLARSIFVVSQLFRHFSRNV